MLVLCDDRYTENSPLVGLSIGEDHEHWNATTRFISSFEQPKALSYPGPQIRATRWFDHLDHLADGTLPLCRHFDKPL